MNSSIVNSRGLPKFCKRIKLLLNEEPLLAKVGKGQDSNFLELFFEKDSHPFTLSIQLGREKTSKFECLFRYKLIPESNYDFEIYMLQAASAEEMTDKIIDSYQSHMKHAVLYVRNRIRTKDTKL